ncbi:MAG: sulfurtransferase-like selenium metabolism protein YedF [Cyanobacteria bacterium TGS_CYA1]|nr:sulfurtransferase-like selenium metabolism protein YedF [Cyanobacteria bacterium TGS_CYA1]
MSEKNSEINQIDLRGLACPEPVLRTKKILDQKSTSPVSLLVDTDVTVKNLERLCSANKAQILESQKVNDHFRVLIAPTSKDSSKEEKKDGTIVGPVVFISKDSFGTGSSPMDHDFSSHLLNMFLQSLLATGHQIDAILMANSGVKIMADSAFKDVIAAFESAGTKVFACGLCVEYYKIKEQVPTEKITNMFAICEYLMTSTRVIEP